MVFQPINISDWVNYAPGNQGEFRQAIYTALRAIARDPLLRDLMIMKGGILMALGYGSNRFTRDIDFSTRFRGTEIDTEKIDSALKASLARTVAESEYDLDCRVQSIKLDPKRPDASFSNLQITIGFARKGTPKHKRLLRLESPDTIRIDFSLNERIIGIEGLDLGEAEGLRVYDFVDLVAEKLRSLMQQESRNRYRRQDVYDLSLLLRDEVGEAEKQAILESLMAKARSRNIHPKADTLENPELARRAHADYHTLADEIEGPLPDFSDSWERVKAFYRSLPWQEQKSSSD